MSDNTKRVPPSGAPGQIVQVPPTPAMQITAAILGNALEFYDFTVYGAFAVFIGKAFFPSENAYASLMLSIATFGIGFVTRPLGGAVIGAYADRAGRKPAMTLTIWLMALGSAMIAFLPTYERIGYAAPALLVLARLIQGFSTGGEMGPATTYLVEAAPRRKRSLFGSWQFASQNLGSVVAGLVGFLLAQGLPVASLESWGWRVPFLLGIVIAPVGIYIRNNLDETLDTSTAHTSGRAVLADLFGKHMRPLLLCFLLISGGTITQYFFIYMTTFAIETLKMPASIALFVNFTIGISGAVFALIGGVLGDRFGLKITAIWPRILLVLALYPAMLLVVETRTALTLFSMTAALMALQALSAGVGIVLIPACFPAAVRTAGLAIAYAVGVTVFGGTAQLIFTWLIKTTGDPMAPVWWVIASNILTVGATILLRPVADEDPQLARGMARG